MSDKWITKIEVIDSEGHRVLYLKECDNKYWTSAIVEDGTLLRIYQMDKKGFRYG